MLEIIGTFRKPPGDDVAADRIYPNKLHHYRDEVLGWTKAELAARAGMSDKTVKNVERLNAGTSATRARIRNAINEGLRELGRPEVDDAELWSTADDPPPTGEPEAE
jgi:hypothetical protein